MMLYKSLDSALSNLKAMDHNGSASFNAREDGDVWYVFEGIEDIIYMSKKVQLFTCEENARNGRLYTYYYLYIVDKQPFVTNDVDEMERHLKDLKEAAYNKTV